MPIRKRYSRIGQIVAEYFFRNLLKYLFDGIEDDDRRI